MARSDSEENRSVALYWDFENLHAGLVEAKFGEGYYGRPDNRFKPQEALIDIQAIVELASSFGPVAINRAYCNWQWYGRYGDALLQSAVELIQLFSPGASAWCSTSQMPSTSRATRVLSRNSRSSACGSWRNPGWRMSTGARTGQSGKPFIVKAAVDATSGYGHAGG